MKIAIIGFSGSGKSTLAKKLSQFYNCDVLHLDSIHFAPNWEERTREEMVSDITRFLKKDQWIIEGNYRQCMYQQRMKDADQIIFLNFNRFNCLFRACKRYLKYKGKTRPDMAMGCTEKLDLDFIRWILKDGRSRHALNKYKNVITNYPQKIIVLKNQHQLNRYIEQFKNDILIEETTI